MMPDGSLKRKYQLTFDIIRELILQYNYPLDGDSVEHSYEEQGEIASAIFDLSDLLKQRLCEHDCAKVDFKCTCCGGDVRKIYKGGE